MNKLTIIVLMAISMSAFADDSVEGAYERMSLTNTRTGESPEAANRQGIRKPARSWHDLEARL